MQTVNQSMAADLTYAWQSTVNVANFVSVRPSVEKKGDDEFRNWREQMLCLLESQDVLGFVDGKIQQLLEAESEEKKKAWRRTDRLVKGWILGSIGRDALHSVSNKETAREVWTELHFIFKDKDGPIPCDGVNVANFVSVKPSVEKKGDLDDEFRNWREQMLCLLKNQDLLGFVDGEIQQPPEAETEEEKKAWRRTDRLVKEWLLGSIGRDALDAVSNKETARDVWLELHAIFEEEEEESDELKGNGDSSSNYLTVYKAAQTGDWDTIKNFFGDSISESIGSIISSSYKETALHVAVLTGKEKNLLVDKLVEIMPLEALERKNYKGNTALHNAAIVGNTAAAAALVNRHPDLLHIRGIFRHLPVLRAAVLCHKETLEYLISKHEANTSLFEGQLGVDLLNQVIGSEFTDIALDLARKYPNLAQERAPNRNNPLEVIAATDNLFPRKETFSWWQRFIYYRIPVKKSTSEADAAHTTSDAALDIENLCSKCNSTSSQIIRGVGQKLELMIWHAVENIVSKVKELRKKKERHQEALLLVKYLCEQISKLPQNEASEIFEFSIMKAAKRGISEVVEIILHTFPSVINHEDPTTGMDIFLMAADYRFEDVFKLINSISDHKYLFYSTVDNNDNNLLHLCGKLASPHRLNLVAGAALQMQRELQWFEEMEKFVHPSHKTSLNKENKTPKMIFTNEHKKLKEDGERWMKDTANACTISAALIATVVFAAAFTVPGGVESATGLPLLSGEPAFSLFAVSNAVSFFTSITSLLMFLSILTSRYAEQDFLRSLPKRLAIGLLSLFLSITFMLLAFSAALYLLFQKDIAWFGLLVAALACLPVTSFVMLQFPLLVDVISYTYGPGIFDKKTDRPLHCHIIGGHCHIIGGHIKCVHRG